jgi:microcystin-dependent protein
MKRQSFVVSAGAALAGGTLPVVASATTRLAGLHQAKRPLPAGDESSRLLGSLFLSPYNFVPKNFAACDGRIMKLSENPALFSLLGNKFGGDLNHFGLPNLTGKAPIKGLSYLIATRGIYPERKGLEGRLFGLDPLLGQLTLVAYLDKYVPPQGWAPCDGRLLTIEGNVALYALLGTTFGGDGIKTFALPDLRGHEPTKGVRYVIALVGRFPSEH